MTTRDVMLAFPHPGLVRAEFMIRIVHAVQHPDSRILELADICTGPAVGMARNQLTHQFLESEASWLWFVDTDMVPSLQTLPAMLEQADPEERPVVGALACILNADQIKASMYTADKDEDGRFAFRHLVEWPHNALLRVDATGCGCLLIHKSVFEKISKVKPEDDGLWFTDMVIDGHQIGEDLSFCMRCALSEIPIFVHTGIEVGHMKTIQLGNVSP